MLVLPLYTLHEKLFYYFHNVNVYLLGRHCVGGGVDAWSGQHVG